MCHLLPCEEEALLAGLPLFFCQTNVLLRLTDRPLEVYLSFQFLLAIKDHNCQ